MRAATDRSPSPASDWSGLFGEIELAPTGDRDVVVYGSTERSAHPPVEPPTSDIDPLIHW